MGAAICTLDAKTYDGALLNLTTMTGGHGDDNGFTGSDWLHINGTADWNNGPDEWIRKAEGGQQILPVRFSAGADPLPTVGGLSAQANTFTCDSGDRTSGSFITTGGLLLTLSSSQLDAGIEWTFPVSTATKTFWWLGHSRNGGWEASAELSDASEVATPYTLPTGALNVYVAGWFEVSFRGTADQVAAGVTVRIAITRVNTGISATAAVGTRPQVLLTPVPAPKPRGMRPGRRH